VLLARYSVQQEVAGKETGGVEVHRSLTAMFRASHILQSIEILFGGNVS
jgi:hypothetical protein